MSAMRLRGLGVALLLALCAFGVTDALRSSRRRTPKLSEALSKDFLGEARALMSKQFTPLVERHRQSIRISGDENDVAAPALLEQFVPTTTSPIAAANQTTNRCPGDCSGGNGVCDVNKCHCMDGFTGADCSIRLCPSNCSNTALRKQGDCEDGVCSCLAGWFGDDCSTPGCVNQCHGQGVCRGQTCTCYDGYEGLNCETRVGCPFACNPPHGVCQEDIATGNASCVCFEPYGGVGCRDWLCPNNCLGRGTCNSTNGVCQCSGNKFHGPDCGLIYCPSGCSGHGSCNDTTGVCQCDPGYHGSNCSPENCALNCSGKGQCVPGNNTTPASCKCDRQWTGDGCDVELCPDLCNENDQHGACTPKGCVCNSTWTGRSCASRRCPDDCSGTSRGICNTKTWECSCLEPWIGDACQEKSCLGNCNYRGKCDNGTCVCGDWWTGAKCEVPRCKNNCSSQGACVLPRIELLRSASSPASTFDTTAARSPMAEDIDRAFCKCVEGWGGPDCSERQCPNSCSGRGQCQGGVCFCDTGYYGVDCTLVESVQVQSANITAEIAARELCTQSCVHGRCLATTHPRTVFKVNESNDLSVLAANSTVKYECFCEKPWGGIYCNESLEQCPQHCKTAAGVCRADCKQLLKCPFFNGKMCGGDDRGDCDYTTGQCKCRSPYHGLDCSTASCPNNCGKHGLCNTKDMKCLCFGGWTGADCTIRVED